MRKRVIAAAVCAAFLLILSWGHPYGTETEDAYDLYFREADLEAVPGGDALRAEKLYLEEGEARDTLELAERLITELIAGPEDPSLQNTIPEETTLLALELDGSRARVDLSSRYQMLSGVALALADYAITLTLTQLPEIAAVSITVRGEPLAYRDRQTFTAGDVLFSSNEDVIGNLPVTLYLLDGEGALVPVELTLDLYEGDTQAGAVLKALQADREGEGLQSPLPEGFRVSSIRMEENTCYVDLPSAALAGLAESPDLQLGLRALADSLLSLRAAEEVRYLVDGEYASTYGSASVVGPYTGETS